MIIYKQLFSYFTKIKKEIVIRALLGLWITMTYIIQAIMMSKIVNLVWNHKSVHEIIIKMLWVLLMIFARGILVREIEAYSKVLAAKIKSKLRVLILEHVYKLGPGYMNAKRSGKVTSMILDGIESLEPFFVSYVPQIITVLLSGTLMIGYLCQYDIVGSVIMAISMLLCVFVPIITVPLINKNVTDYWIGYSQLTSQYIDTIQGMTTLKILNAEKTRGEYLKKDVDGFYKKSIRNTGISLVNSSIMLVLTAVVTSITVVIVAYRVNLGMVSPTGITLFLFLGIECGRPMMDLNRYWHSSFLGLSVAKDFFELLETEPNIKEIEDADTWSLEHALPSIELKNVSFSYKAGSQAVKNVSFTIPSGKTVALVGSSGSGKSTILNLLLRFYDVSEGEILINQKNIRKYNLDYLQKNIAIVFQDSYLFYGTIEENILMARPTASKLEVIEAAKAANAHEFIEKLPNGYQTIVGERGATLSGGECQRLSIARAILKDAPILLLDEATASVDSTSESLIQNALVELTQNRTTVVVAHRLSTIYNADKIFVLKEGNLVEEGTHEELLETKGTYYKLVEAQKEIQS